MIPVLADSGNFVIIFAIIVGVTALILAASILAFFSVWLRAKLAGTPIPMTTLVAMKLRKVPYQLVTDAHIAAAKAGIPIGTDYLEAHYLASGNIMAVVQALILAHKANIDLDWDRACAIDLSSAATGQRGVLDIVNTSIETNQPVVEVWKASLHSKP
jgi:uncharacterized protein YqfA (UPF0365 family)